MKWEKYGQEIDIRERQAYSFTCIQRHPSSHIHCQTITKCVSSKAFYLLPHLTVFISIT